MKIDFLNGMQNEGYMSDQLLCDRCKEPVKANKYYVKVTAVHPWDGTPSWAKYFKRREHVLCQDCLRHDKRYIADMENLNALSR